MIAFVQDSTLNFDLGERSSLDRKPIKFERAKRQHANFQKALKSLGLEVERFPALSDQPGSVFVNDAVVLLPEVAVIAPPTNPARHPEIESIAKTLAGHRPVQHIGEPGILNGNDVLAIDHTIHVSRSKQTNDDGISGLREIVAPFGYEVRTVETVNEGGLRAACSFIPPHFVLLNPQWIEPSAFGDLVPIPVAETEPAGAATLTLHGTTLVSAAFPETEKRLQTAGITTRRVDISELEKVGGSLARLCLIKEPRATKPALIDHGSALKVVETTQVPSLGQAAQAIVHGGCAYVSAQLPFDPTAPNLPKMSLEEQTEQVLRNVALVLHAAGSSLADVLHATVHLADPKHLDRIEAIYARMFAGHRPVRSVISNRALPAGVLVEIEVVAAVSKGRHR